MKTHFLLLSSIFLHGCGVAPAVEQSELENEARIDWWEVGPTTEKNVSEALSVCLAIVKEETPARAFLTAGGWVKRDLPRDVENQTGKEIFQKQGRPEFIALGSVGSLSAVCSVISSISHDKLVAAVDSLDGKFSDGFAMMPHGPWWTADGIRIDNDYADNHVFDPLVFNPNDFSQSRVSDIRVYRCKEYC